MDMGLTHVEIDREWTLEDVLDANEALDLALDVDEMRACVREARRKRDREIREDLRGPR